MKGQLKVVILNSCVHGGGAGRSLAAYLSNQGRFIEAHVVMPEPGVMAKHMSNARKIWYVPEFVERIQTSAYSICRKLGWSWLQFVSNWFAIPNSCRKIAQIVREIKPDVIYCNHMLAKPVGVVVGYMTNTPVVLHARNIHYTWFGRHFYQFLGSRSIVQAIICNSEATSEVYREYSDAKVHVVYNSLDLKRFRKGESKSVLREQHGIGHDEPIIGYVGRIVPWKGIDLLIKAFRRISILFPDARLCIVGDNDKGVHQDLAGQYKQLTEQLGIADRTIFIPFQDDIRPHVSDFDVLAVPSVKPEPFGRVIIEAMALGVCPLVAAHGGAREIVRHQHNGLWFTPNSENSLSNRLSQILQDREMRLRMALQAVKDVENLFSANKLSPRITDILNHVHEQNLGGVTPVIYPDKRVA